MYDGSFFKILPYFFIASLYFPCSNKLKADLMRSSFANFTSNFSSRFTSSCLSKRHQWQITVTCRSVEVVKTEKLVFFLIHFEGMFLHCLASWTWNFCSFHLSKRHYRIKPSGKRHTINLNKPWYMIELAMQQALAFLTENHDSAYIYN